MGAPARRLLRRSEAWRRCSGLQCEDGECYFMTVARLLTLLILFALAVTNGPAVAMAMCQHGDARAHSAARQSSDTGAAAAAMNEEAAAKAASEQASLGDAAGTLLAGYMLPGDPLPLPKRVVEASVKHMPLLYEPGGRTVRPLLEPPLA